MKVNENDVKKFLYYVLSNEKQSLKDNPFREESERHKLKTIINNFLEEEAKKIAGRE